MTKQVKIYHNPRCSKSRETLNLLKENGVEPEVVLYLETPADAATLRDLLKMLGMNSARELMRQKEDLYKELNLADSSLSEEALIQAMVDNPKLMERRLWSRMAKRGLVVHRSRYWKSWVKMCSIAS